MRPSELLAIRLHGLGSNGQSSLEQKEWVYIGKGRALFPGCVLMSSVGLGLRARERGGSGCLRREHQRRHVCLLESALQAREGTTFFVPNSQESNVGSSHATTMATQQDLQELLRLQTARKMPMKDAMAQIKALQGASLKRKVTASFANWQTP